MATFKVGQRVRIVACDGPSAAYLVGVEGVITQIPSTFIKADCVVHEAGNKIGIACNFHHLTPLTDPGADAFMERMRRLGREPVSDAPKVVAKERT